MQDWNIFAAIDVSIRDLLGGFAGGVVNALVFTRTSPWTAVGSMIVGALTAAYLTDAAVAMTGISQKPASFIVGLGGMAICQGIIGAIRNYKFGGALNSNGSSNK
jgi:ABC-type xylose transport system permease subunit